MILKFSNDKLRFLYLSQSILNGSILGIRIITFTILVSVFFQKEASAQGKLKKALERREKKKEQWISEGKPWITPLIAPAYTPEHGLLVAGGMLLTFKPDKSDSISQRSSMPATIYYSSKGSFGIKGYLKTFWFEDRVRINTVVAVNDRDNHFYGKGYDRIDQVSKSDTTTKYRESFTGLDIDLLYRLRPSLYAGIKFKPWFTRLSDVADPVNKDTYKSQFDNSYFLNGLGFHIAYDTRDIVVNAWEGIFVDFSALFFDKSLGSDYTFQVYEFDTRYYQRINRDGNVLAFRLYSKNAFGDVPITELADFAGGRMLRGYIKGHYRDNTSGFFEAEWRHTFRKSDGGLSKAGFVAWGGAGYISPQLTEIKKILPNYGVGFRFEVQPRMNARIDFGLGKGTSGLYFNFNEAF